MRRAANLFPLHVMRTYTALNGTNGDETVMPFLSPPTPQKICPSALRILVLEQLFVNPLQSTSGKQTGLKKEINYFSFKLTVKSSPSQYLAKYCVNSQIAEIPTVVLLTIVNQFI